jgi:2-polyprenyl-3-methyl-5-hydroxy-6-metoxy-1,4-benzoquinol methylase
METKNKKLAKKKENRKYYSKSDGIFMDPSQALYAHRVLDRVKWARNWVHELASRTHLDIGCKDGYLCLTLGAEGIECVGIDPSEDAIDEAQLRVSENRTSLAVEPVFILGYGEDMPDEVRADTVSCLEVLEHVVDPDSLLQKLSETGRYVMICTPDIHGKHGLKDAERNPEHIRLYEKKELEKLVSGYGTILESEIRDGQICIIFKSNSNE